MTTLPAIARFPRSVLVLGLIASAVAGYAREPGHRPASR